MLALALVLVSAWEAVLAAELGGPGSPVPAPTCLVRAGTAWMGNDKAGREREPVDEPTLLQESEPVTGSNREKKMFFFVWGLKIYL